jgi:hypothetical protein
MLLRKIIAIYFENYAKTYSYFTGRVWPLYATITGIFPEPEHDPVIQIANMVVQQGQPEPFLRNVFTLNTCAPIVGCQVLSFTDERELLEVCLVIIKTLCKHC